MPINRRRGQSERVEGHSVQQRRISRHSGTNNIHDSRTTCLLPLVNILLSQGFFFFFISGRFIHLIVKRIMNFMQVKITKKGNTWSQCNPRESNNSVLLRRYEVRKNPTLDIQCFWRTHFQPISDLLHFPGCYATALRNLVYSTISLVKHDIVCVA